MHFQPPHLINKYLILPLFVWEKILLPNKYIMFNLIK